MSNESALPIAEVIDGEQVSAELRPLLLEIYNSLEQLDKADKVADVVERLLLFLSSAAGRTNANCVAADQFLCLRDGWGEVSWEHLPPELGEVLSIAGDALHDAVAHPAIAENFGCTPEQLLDQLQRARL